MPTFLSHGGLSYSGLSWASGESQHRGDELLWAGWERRGPGSAHRGALKPQGLAFCHQPAGGRLAQAWPARGTCRRGGSRAWHERGPSALTLCCCWPGRGRSALEAGLAGAQQRATLTHLSPAPFSKTRAPFLHPAVTRGPCRCLPTRQPRCSQEQTKPHLCGSVTPSPALGGPWASSRAGARPSSLLQAWGGHDAAARSPLCGWPVHDDVDPQDLHGVEGAGQVEHGGEGDEAQGRDAPAGTAADAAVSPLQTGAQDRGPSGLHSRAQLEPDEVLDVVEDALALLHGASARGGRCGQRGPGEGPASRSAGRPRGLRWHSGDTLWP